MSKRTLWGGDEETPRGTGTSRSLSHSILAPGFACLFISSVSGCGGLFSQDPGGGDGDTSVRGGDGDGDGPGDGDVGGDGDGDGDGDVGGDGDGTSGPPKPPFDWDDAPDHSRVVPLTNRHWAHAVQTILKLPEPASQADTFLDPVRGFTLFDNNERVLIVNNAMRESYQLAAAEVALEQSADSDALSRIDAGSDADTFIRTLGRRAYRRPLTEDEVASYEVVYDVGVSLPGDASAFEKGANLVLEVMLQSPHFLYRSELTPDGAPLNGYEVISKLSFWILGTSPDDSLLDRAAAGEFDSPDGVADVAEEMLGDPRATEMIVDLYSQLFWFSRYEDVLKEDPMWSPELNDELRLVSELFFEHIYESELGLRAVLNSTEGFVGPLLAEFYGISPAPDAPALFDLGPQRPGYFSQVPYQMVTGAGSHSDAIHRGIPITFRVMCAELVAPEDIEVPALPPPDPNRTDRQHIEVSTGWGTCGEGCHIYINNLGYAFENFDGLGRERTVDNGQPVDTTSSYPFGDDGEPWVSFDGAPELMDLISQSEEAHMCLAKSLVSYALGRDITIDDQPLLLNLAGVSQSSAGSIKQLLREVIKSPTFLSRPEVN